MEPNIRLFQSHLLITFLGFACGSLLSWTEEIRLHPFVSSSGTHFQVSTSSEFYYHLLKGTTLDSVKTIVDSSLGNGQVQTLTDLSPSSLDPIRFYKIVARKRDDPLDSDNDGMTDAFEMTYPFLDPLSALDAQQDYDTDGQTNLQEFQEGTRPDQSHLTRIESVFPHPSANFIDLMPTIKLRFTRPLSPNTRQVLNGIELKSGSTPIPFRPEISQDLRELILRTDTVLLPNSTITLHFNGREFSDENGLWVDADSDGIPGGIFKYSFQTLGGIFTRTPGISGRLLDATKKADPLGATYSKPINSMVLINNSPLNQVDNPDNFGRFHYSALPVGNLFMDILPNPPTPQSSDGFYPPIRFRVKVLSHYQWNPTVNDGSIYLPLVPSETEWKRITGLTQSTIEIPPSFSQDYPDFQGTQLLAPTSETPITPFGLSWVPIRGDRLPFQLPTGLSFDQLIWVLCTAPSLPIPVHVKLPNTLPDTHPGATTRIWHYNTLTAKWRIIGNGVVSEDGRWIVNDSDTFIRDPGIYGAARVEMFEFFPHPFEPLPPLTESSRETMINLGILVEDLIKDAPNKPLSRYPIQTLYLLRDSLNDQHTTFENLKHEYQQAAIHPERRLSWLDQISQNSQLQNRMTLIFSLATTLTNSQWRAALENQLNQFFPDRVHWTEARDRLTLSLHHPAVNSEAKHLLLKHLDILNELLARVETYATELSQSNSLHSVLNTESSWQELLIKINSWKSRPNFVPWPNTAPTGYQQTLNQLDQLAIGLKLDPSVTRKMLRLMELEADIYQLIPQINPYLLEVNHIPHNLQTGFYSFSLDHEPPSAQHHNFGESISFYLPWSARTQVGWVDILDNTVTLHKSIALDSNGSTISVPEISESPFDPNLDNNGNGLPDELEFIQVFTSNTHDKDNDGVPNQVEFQTGTFFDRSGQASAGTLDISDTLGKSSDMALDEDLVMIADEAHGIEIFDIANRLIPLRIGIVPLPSKALEVCFAGASFVARCADGNIYWLPIKNLGQEGHLNQYHPGEPIQSMHGHDSTLYLTTTTPTAISVSLPSGTEQWRLPLASQPIDLFRISHGKWRGISDTQIVLGTIEPGPLFKVFPFDPRSPLPIKSFFMGKDWAWISQNGIPARLTFDELAWTGLNPLTTFNGSLGQVVMNESETGIAYVYPDNRNPSSIQEATIQTLRYSEDSPSLEVLGSIPFKPSSTRTEKLALWKGMAYSLENERHLRRLQYIQPKADVLRPQGILQTSASDGMVSFGDTVRITAEVTDDHMVEKVQFRINQKIIDTDGNFPFETEWRAPFQNEFPRLPEFFIIDATAWDEAGNMTFLESVKMTLTQHLLPPQIIALSGISPFPIESKDFSSITVEFSDIIRPESVNSNSIRLIHAGRDRLFGTTDDQTLPGFSFETTNSGYSLVLRWSGPLPVGLLRFQITEELKNLKGVPMKLPYHKDFWVHSTIRWIGDQDGFWHDPTRWDLGRLPNQDDLVIIETPSTTTIQIIGAKVLSLHASANLILKSGILSLHEPSEIRKLTQTGGTFLVGNDLVMDHYELTDGVLQGSGTITINSTLQWHKGMIDFQGIIENWGNFRSFAGPCEVENLTLHNHGFAQLKSWIPKNSENMIWFNDKNTILTLLLSTSPHPPFSHLENNGDVFISGTKIQFPSLNHLGGELNLENSDQITLGKGRMNGRLRSNEQATLLLGASKDSDTLIFGPEATLIPPPAVTIQGRVDNNSNLTLKSLTLLGGTLAGNGNLRTDSMIFNKGLIQGSGAIHVSDQFDCFVNRNIGLSSTRMLLGKSLHIYSSGSLSTSIQVGEGGKIYLHPEATLDLASNHEILLNPYYSNQTALYLFGTTHLVSNEDLSIPQQSISTFSLPVTQTGKLILEKGRSMRFENNFTSSGIIEFESGSSLEFASGYHNLDGVLLEGTSEMKVLRDSLLNLSSSTHFNTIKLQGGSLRTQNSVSVDHLIWSAGTLDHANLSVQSTLQFKTDQSRFLDSSVLINNGNTEWLEGGDLVMNFGSLIENSLLGQWIHKGSGNWLHEVGSFGRFINHGFYLDEGESNKEMIVEIHQRGILTIHRPLTDLSLPFHQISGETVFHEGTVILRNQLGPGLIISGGALSCDALLDGSINSNAQLNPGVQKTKSMPILRNLQMGDLSRCVIEVNNPTEFDQVDVAGNILLGGTLVVQVDDNFSTISPVLLPIFRTSDLIDGRFTRVEGLDSSPLYDFQILYRQQEVLLEVQLKNR